MRVCRVRRGGASSTGAPVVPPGVLAGTGGGGGRAGLGGRAGALRHNPHSHRARHPEAAAYLSANGTGGAAGPSILNTLSYGAAAVGAAAGQGSVWQK